MAQPFRILDVQRSWKAISTQSPQDGRGEPPVSFTLHFPSQLEEFKMIKLRNQEAGNYDLGILRK